MNRYGSVYPCIAGSGGVRIFRCVSTRAAGGPGLWDVYRTVSCSTPDSLTMRVPNQHEFHPPSCYTELGYLY